MARPVGLLAFAAVLAIGLGVPAVPQAAIGLGGGDAAVFYEDALRLYAKGDLNGALIQLKNVLQSDDRNIGALVLKGKIHLKLRQYPEALHELQRARELGADEALVTLPIGEAMLDTGAQDDVLKRFVPRPGSPALNRDIHTLRGYAYMARDQLDEAEKEFQAGAALVRTIVTPDDAAPARGLARVAIERGKPEEARRLLEPLVGRLPHDADLMFLLADISRKEGAIDKAIEQLGRTIDADPNHMQARLTRAALLIDRRKYDAALEDIDYVQEKVPRQPDSYYLEIVAELRRGDREAANKAMAKADELISTIEPRLINQNPTMLFLAGMVKYLQGNLNDAETYLRMQVALRPGSLVSRKLLAQIFLATKEPKDVITLLEPVVQAGQGDTEIFGLLGEAYLRTRRYEDAARMLERAAEEHPDARGIQSRLAYSRIATGDYDAAASDLTAYLRTNPKDARAAFTLGYVYLKNGKYKQALSAAERMIRTFPRSPAGYNLAGAAYERLKRSKEARAQFQRALAIDSNFAPAVLNLAKLDRVTGRQDDARTGFLHALKLQPTDLRPMVELSRMAEASGDRDTAIEWLKKAVRADRHATPAYLDLARLQLLTNRLDDALRTVLAAQNVDPSNPNVLFALAQVYLQRQELEKARLALQTLSPDIAERPALLVNAARLQVAAGDNEAAVANLRKAIDRDPKYQPARTVLVTLFVDQGRYDDARREIAAYRTALPGSALPDRLEGDIDYRQQRYDEAAKAYRRAYAAAPDGATLARLTGSLRAAGRTADAIKLLVAWHNDNPKDTAIGSLLAYLYSEDGDLARATALYETLMKAAPRDPRIKNNLAELYGRMGDPRALPLAKQAYALAPDRPSTLDTLGWLTFKAGDAERAAPLLREAYTRDSNNPAIQYHLAAVLAERGRTQEARKLLEAALSSKRKFSETEEARALLGRL